MTPQERDHTFDEEARRALAQVYTLLLDLARENASKEDTSTDDLNAPESTGKVHSA
jgi:hypothetical protein